MSSKYGGYMGKVVQVDLATGTVSPYPWTDRDRELFIGGKIMAAKILSGPSDGHGGAFFRPEPADHCHRSPDRYRRPQLQQVQHLHPV